MMKTSWLCLVALGLTACEPLYVEIFKAWTSDAVLAITHFQPKPMVYARGLTGQKQPWVGDSAMIWNSWEWSWTAP